MKFKQKTKHHILGRYFLKSRTYRLSATETLKIVQTIYKGKLKNSSFIISVSQPSEFSFKGDSNFSTIEKMLKYPYKKRGDQK